MLTRSCLAACGLSTILLTAVLALQTTGENARWLAKPGHPENVTLHQLSWHGRALQVDGYDEPRLEIRTTAIDADRQKHLYLVLGLPSPAQLSVFFAKAPGGGFSYDRMGTVRKPVYREGVRAYRLDFRAIPEWAGRVEGLRVSLEGMREGATVEFLGVAVSSEPLEKLAVPGADSHPVEPLETSGPYKAERMVACGRTVLSISEAVPTPGLCTYIDHPYDARDFDPLTQYSLAKFVVSTVINGRQVGVREAAGIRVTPKPGRLTADYSIGAVKVHVEALPLRTVSDTEAAEGAALVKVSTSPATPLIIDAGGMVKMSVWKRDDWLRDATLDQPGNRLSASGRTVLLESAGVPRVVAFRASGSLSVAGGSQPRARVEFNNGSGWMLAAFARDATRAAAMANTDVEAGERSVEEHYARLLGPLRISTPEPEMDEAFRAAILNMDYAWVRPFGTMESLHHWWALWQQYPSSVFDWIGLQDRSRASIVSHAERQYKSGNIPYLMLYGERHEDFGGNNQTFMAQVQHYLRSSNDKTLAAQIAPNLKRVIEAFYRYEDPDSNRLPGFGVQILTQEDYVATPHEGTSPAVAGVEMWRTLALVERMLGHEAAAREYESEAVSAAGRLRAALWQPDLGRPAYFRDELGNVRPDGQYHTLVLPIVSGLLNPLEAWTSMRHLRDRLTGPSGEIYYSNNFPHHMSGVKGSPFGPTWGHQAGAYMQGWGAWGLARVGLVNEAYRPLRMAAKWAMMYPKLGSWGESSTELTPAYFANTAASYTQAVIEALFGLEMDLPAGVLRVQPAFPDAWPQASISLAEADAAYRREGHSFTYDVRTRLTLKRRVRWLLPVNWIETVTVNGRPQSFSTEPGVNGIWLAIETEPLDRTSIAVRYQPLAWRIDHPGSVAEGDEMEIAASGCDIAALEDPGKLARSVSQGAGHAAVRLSTGVLEPWLSFGRLGQLNFSRRSLFLKCSAEGQPFWAAVDFTLLPRYEAAAGKDLIRTGQGHAVEIVLRNNTGEPLGGPGALRWADLTARLGISVAPRSESTLRVPLRPEDLASLTPGDNEAELELPEGQVLHLKFPVKSPFAGQTALSARLRSIPLPAEALVEDSRWMEFAAFPVYWQGPFNSLPPPLQAVAGKAPLRTDEIPAVSFPLENGRKLAIASHRLGRPVVRIPLDQRMRKIYLLTLAFVENQDVFTRCGDVSVTCERRLDDPPFDSAEEPVQWTRARYPEVTFRRVLTTPGDLDNFFSEAHAGSFASARGERSERYGLLPLLGISDGDWPEGMPLASPYGIFTWLGPAPHDGWPEGNFRSFPQWQYWASCPAIRTSTATFNVVEVDLGRTRRVKRIDFESLLQDAALGVVSAVAFGGD